MLKLQTLGMLISYNLLFLPLVQTRRTNLLLLLCPHFLKIHSIIDAAQIPDKHTQENVKTKF